jgi:hypothetical protein
MSNVTFGVQLTGNGVKNGDKFIVVLTDVNQSSNSTDVGGYQHNGSPVMVNANTAIYSVMVAPDPSDNGADWVVDWPQSIDLNAGTRNLTFNTVKVRGRKAAGNRDPHFEVQLTRHALAGVLEFISNAETSGKTPMAIMDGVEARIKHLGK